ncbi:GGDEF domain-containing protein [Vibrio maerlii]|uniref:GGDEF domain-containing protein n=1 Tax=Vibrio maerlii TaxID=2231648 RepID=UPI000E3D544C|nr:GGDEF domain-containing protein [Vibrio maerlii]
MLSNFATTSLFRCLFPILLVTILFIGRDNVTILADLNQSLVLNLPYLFTGIAILLSHSFNQGRTGYVAVALAYSYFIIQTSLQAPLSNDTTILKLTLLTFLLPVSCLSVHIFADNRVFSKSGIKYFAVLAFFTVWSVMTVDHFAGEPFIETMREGVLFRIPELSRIPFVLVAYLFALIGLTAILVLKFNRAIDVVIYSTILLTSLTFIGFHIPYISSVLFSLAGLLLIVYVLSASHELAFMDQLTGIPGRYALDSELKQLGRRYSIAMLDIDHFKSFNDTYGHDTGDDVLKLVASKMRSLQGRARIYRYGGEEFTLLFKRKHAEQVIDFLDTLRQEVEDYEMVIRNSESRPEDNKLGKKSRGKESSTKSVKITISIGVSDSRESRDPQEVIKFADKALYQAKEGGRNCVCIYE